MDVELLSGRNPKYLAAQKVVDCFVHFTVPYTPGGLLMRAGEFGLSEITDVDECIAEGFVLRIADGIYPPRLQVFGKDSVTIDQRELPAGYDLSALENVRLRVYGW